MIHINGIIGEGENTLVSIIAKIQEEKGDIHVLIDSIGGDLDEGVSIFNYLNTKNVTTECVNNCASIASIIFLAGANRIAGCPIMIHNPWTQAVGDSQELKAVADFLQEKEGQLEKIYASFTNIDKTVLSDLMDNETYISPSQAVSLGFATQAKQIALAKLNLKIDDEMSKFNFLSKKSKKEEVKTYNLLLTADDGSTLTVDREEGAPEVGDSASPDGTYIVEGVGVIVVADGVIASIDSTSAEGDTEEGVIEQLDTTVQELEAAIGKIEELEAELVQARKLAKSPEDIKVLNAVRIAGGLDKLAKEITSSYRPQARVSKEVVSNSNPLAEKLAQLKAERGL